MSDTPRTDAIITADWHMPKGWKDRIHEHARQLERELTAKNQLLVACRPAAKAYVTRAELALAKVGIGAGARRRPGARAAGED
jgi:hypothetical protein